MTESGEGGADEARYIVQETSRVFRERKNLRDAEIIAGALDEGEGRLQTALHYGIAYPRMTHTPLAGGGDVKNVLPPAEAGGSWIVHGGRQGQGLLVLDLYRPGAEGAWTNVSRWSVDVEREQLDEEIAPALRARLDRARAAPGGARVHRRGG